MKQETFAGMESIKSRTTRWVDHRMTDAEYLIRDTTNPFEASSRIGGSSVESRQKFSNDIDVNVGNFTHDFTLPSNKLFLHL